MSLIFTFAVSLLLCFVFVFHLDLSVGFDFTGCKSSQSNIAVKGFCFLSVRAQIVESLFMAAKIEGDVSLYFLPQ